MQLHLRYNNQEQHLLENDFALYDVADKNFWFAKNYKDAIEGIHNCGFNEGAHTTDALRLHTN